MFKWFKGKKSKGGSEILEYSGKGKGYSRVGALKENFYMYLTFPLVGAVIATYGFLDNDSLMTFMGGLLIACPIRDIAWVGGIKKHWGYGEEFYDWTKIEKVANESDGETP